MTTNANRYLNNAKSAKQDEFYTRIEDISEELKHYKEHLNGKVIFCNCDDPKESNFWKFFKLKFKEYGLKKLISTHYDATKSTYKLEYEGGDTYPEIPLIGNGDFRSPECVELLKEADVVVTNPPFSLFREYVAQLMEYEKKFLIIGSLNAITYKEIFPLIQENKIWLGYNNGYKEYIVPNHYEPKEDGYRIENGIRYRGMGNTYWFTNLEIQKRHEELVLYRTYNKKDYPTYDNYDAINVDKIKNIPVNYYGLMGVPITFVDKYNPDQFEIIGNEYDLGLVGGRGYVKGKRMYSRIFIKRRVK